MTDTARFAIYARQSLDREGAGLAVNRQIEDCLARARQLGYCGDALLFRDNDVSASRRRSRPQYRALLEAIRLREVDALMIWHNDRLHRRPIELEEFIELAESTGLVVHAVRAGLFDLSTPTGRMTARIVGAVARQEVEHKSERRARSNLQRAQLGVRAGGTRGFGYGKTVVIDGLPHDRDLTRVNRREAAAIRDAARRIIAGETTTTIWRSWNTAGLRTPKGALWQASTFRRSMTRPALAGMMVYRGEVLPGVGAKAAALLSVDELRAVQAVFARPERYRCKPQPVRGLLDRVAICGACGAPLRLRINSKRRRNDGAISRFRTYCCPGTAAGHSSIVAHIPERAVTSAVVDLLTTLRRDPRGATSEQATATSTAVQMQLLAQREQRLVDAVAAGTLTSAMVRSAMAAIHADRAGLEAEPPSPHMASPPGQAPSEVAERFLRALPAATVRHWPAWFSAAHPDLATGVLRHQLRDAFQAQSLPVQQAIVRASVKVVIWPHASPRERIEIIPL